MSKASIISEYVFIPGKIQSTWIYDSQQSCLHRNMCSYIYLVGPYLTTPPTFRINSKAVLNVDILA